MQIEKKALIVVNLAGFLNFLWNDIDTLQDMGFKVEVAMNGKMADGSLATEVKMLKKMGITFYQIDFNTKKPLSKNNLSAYKSIKKILKSNYDLVHCHTPIVGMITRLAANKYRKKGTRVIYTTHGFTFTDKSSKKTWLTYYVIEYIMSFFCDAIITINHEDYYNAKKMRCKNVYIIPGVGIDNRRFNNVKIDIKQYREENGISPNDILILAVGELSKRKNHQVIVKAISHLENKDKIVFVICGRAVTNNNIKKELEDLAKKLKVKIIFAGHRSDIPEMNICADLIVMPSMREGLGMSGLEAMASGKPVVGSDVQGIREYVKNGITGYLCDPMDDIEFSDSIRKIIGMSEDKRREMSFKCKEMARKFDVTKSKKAMYDIYEEIICK